jgi:hypothetical protein
MIHERNDKKHLSNVQIKNSLLRYTGHRHLPNIKIKLDNYKVATRLGMISMYIYYFLPVSKSNGDVNRMPPKSTLINSKLIRFWQSLQNNK